MGKVGLGLLLLLMVTPSLATNLSNCISPRYYPFVGLHLGCIPESPFAENYGVNSSQQKAIVNMHNMMRSRLPATNMQKMVWDSELAGLAQKLANSCGSRKDLTLNIPGRFRYSQSMYASRVFLDWNDVIHHRWYEYGQGTEPPHPVFTNMMQATFSKIGCGHAYCTKQKRDRYYCNYGPSSHDNASFPYISGEPCSMCPAKCYNGTLCDCGGKACENGGTLDINTCECTCPDTWRMSSTCGIDCASVQEPENCTTSETYFEECLNSNEEQYKCPVTCNICELGQEQEQTEISGGTVKRASIFWLGAFVFYSAILMADELRLFVFTYHTE